MTTSPSPRIIPLSAGPENLIEGVWPDRVLKAVTRAELHVYPVENPLGRVLVCAGGGYLALMLDREGDDVARWLNDLGYEAHVLVHPVEHALNIITTARDAGLDLDAHIFGTAPHGFALREKDGTHAVWPDLARQWLVAKT